MIKATWQGILPVLACALSLGIVPAQAADDYAQTRYPVVLVHGASGFDELGPLDYWYRIPADLRRSGASVHVAQVSAYQASEVRGEQLLAQVRQILAVTGATKVNLVGHSHGSHTARYVAGVVPGRVASVTAIGGPNKGSPIFDDIAASAQTNGVLSEWSAALANAVGYVLSGDRRLPQDYLASVLSLTTAGSADFNRRFPAGIPTDGCGEGARVADGVRYYSWSGTAVRTNPLDLTDLRMLRGSRAFSGTADPENDGVTGRCSSHLGMVVRDDFRMNHADEVNQVLGLTSLFETNPVSVIRQHINRLKSAGL